MRCAASISFASDFLSPASSFEVSTKGTGANRASIASVRRCQAGGHSEGNRK